MSFDLIEYLKGPELVVKFQEFFGVQYINRHESDSAKPSQEINETRTTSKESSLCEPQNTASKKDLPYRINNKFWYYLFLIGTELGDEIFYCIFIPCWFWNVDSAVGRRVIFLWSIVMYIGQSLKDIIRWQRPGRPVYQLQKKWSIEYGMPSTHAMVAVSIPFSVLIFTQQRYIYPAQVGLAISILWCTVVCLSRIYLGMHSVLDVIAGIVLTFGLMIVLVPLVDYLDIYIVTSVYSPIFVLYVSIFLIYYYPQSKEKWTPTRGDTTMTISVCAGLQIGAWVNYQLGYMTGTPLEEPHIIIWPTFQMWGHVILRTFLGLAGVVATRFCAKYISYYAFCAILGKDQNEVRNSPSSLQNKIKTIVELGCKYFTCGMIGFNIHFSLANAFKLIGIARPDFYTEI